MIDLAHRLLMLFFLERGGAMNSYTCRVAVLAAVLTSAIMVSQAAALTANPGRLTFTAQQGQNPASQTITVSKDNNRRVGWISSDSANWLTVTPSSGQITNSTQIVITANSSGLTAGTYSGTVKIAAQKGGSVTIPVTLNITALLGAPSIQPTVTSATITWIANTETDLAGYKIYIGMAPGVYASPVVIGQTTSYVANNLLKGNTYYFAVSAFDTSGNESALSAVVSKSIY
jgi:hypothetical protein